MRGWRAEERLVWKLVGKGSRRGSTWPSRAGDVLRHPIIWTGFAATLALSGPRGRRAATRGAACAATSSLIHLLVKPFFRRPRPRGAQLLHVGPVTSSFPSGHTATDLAFMFGSAQEIPLLLAPLSFATLGSHWSMIRGREHYPSDVLAGGALASAVAAAAWMLWPPKSPASRAAAAQLAAAITRRSS